MEISLRTENPDVNKRCMRMLDIKGIIKNWKERRANEKKFFIQESRLSLEKMETEAKILKLTFKEMTEQYKEQKKRGKTAPTYVS